MQKYNESVERQGGRCKCDGSFDPPVYIEAGEEEHPTFYIWIWCGQHHNVGWNLNASIIMFSFMISWKYCIYFFIVSCHMFDIIPYRMYVIFGFKFFFLNDLISFFFLCVSRLFPQELEKKKIISRNLYHLIVCFISNFQNSGEKKKTEKILFSSLKFVWSLPLVFKIFIFIIFPWLTALEISVGLTVVSALMLHWWLLGR